MKTVPFLDAVRDVSAGNAKIPQSDFASDGKLAIVDQGKSLIAGYTDDLDSAVRSPAPLIVFGDHTRALKFVDFAFAMGADGVKVLQARDGFHPKYVYHCLRSHKIPSAGYSRHFKFLKQVDIPKPPLPEQRRIAAILDHADALRAKRRQVLAHLDSLTQSIFHDMFGSRDDDVAQLAEVVRTGTMVTYGIVQAGNEYEGGVPYIRTGDLVDGQIMIDGLRRTDPAIAAKFERSKVATGDIVMSIRATVGTTALVPPEIEGANLTQGTARIAPGDRVTGSYLLGYLRSPLAQRWIQAQVKGATFREITLGRLRQLEVPLPPMQNQGEYARRVQRVRAQGAVIQRALAADDELFASLHSRAFRGEL